MDKSTINLIIVNCIYSVYTILKYLLAKKKVNVDNDFNVVFNMVLKENIQPIEIPFTLTESAANTFTTDSNGIDIPVDLSSNEVFDIDRIEVYGQDILPNAAGRCRSTFQLTLHLQTGYLYPNNMDVVAQRVVTTVASAANTIGGIIEDKFKMETVGFANYIAKNKIFPIIQGANENSAQSVYGRIIGSRVKVSRENLDQLVLNQYNPNS